MTFREILTQIVDGTPGGLAGAIMGSDGIAIDEYRAPGCALELSAVAVEFQRVLEQARKVSGSLYGKGSEPEELVLVTRDHQLLFRQVDEEYFVALALLPNGVLGKARYLVRSLLDSLRSEL